jgi:hypothetical protein
MYPTDPIEGILVSQLAVANEAALPFIVVPGHAFEAHTKYLQLADKAARTVALLSERVDHHRGQ